MLFWDLIPVLLALRDILGRAISHGARRFMRGFISNIASEQRAKVVYEYLYRQIDDKKVKETIDFLLNREEAHNAMFRDAFNKVQSSGSNRDFGTTKAAKMYFSMSEPSPSDGGFEETSVNPVSFNK